MNVLIIGSGGREHALAWSIKQSPLCEALYCAPGNAGIAEIATCLAIDTTDNEAVVKAAREKNIGLVVIGPEIPLVAGLGDALRAQGIPVFGPNKNAAQIEGSKVFMKDLCKQAGIPTADYASFNDTQRAHDYVVAASAASGVPETQFSIVVKASGLAAGKGVTVATSLQQALDAINNAKEFGEAGNELVIEETMEGEEASFFALIDGPNAVFFAHAQDHKRAFDGDKGPNTGGMGAYSPAPVVTDAMREVVMQKIILPTARALNDSGAPFCGVLFAGLMITKTGPRLIEFNARFGDPETQCMLPRLKSDLLEALYKTATGRLQDVKLEWKSDAALCVVMAAKGYPGTYEKNTAIHGLEEAAKIPDAVVFHAGTRRGSNGEILSVGGRVLGVTGWGASIKDARGSAYEAVDKINWDKGFCRRDIGWRAL